MKVMVDIDNTICVHENRDYENAKPIWPVINKVNELYRRGVDVCLYTSRGQNSCGGDLKLIVERNENVLVNWLKRYGVCYNELIFGKPLADFYIDDGGMNVNDFLDSSFEVLQGNSNSQVVRFGNTVVKTAKNAKYQFDWYNRFDERLGTSAIRVPQHRLLTLNTIKMDYVDGDSLAVKYNEMDLKRLFDVVAIFSVLPALNTNIDSYIDNCKRCYTSDMYTKAVRELSLRKNDLLSQVSFCHGDLSFSNVILSLDDSLVLIDPNERECDSYLFDLAKMRCSCDGLENILGQQSCVTKNAVEQFDIFADELGYDLQLIGLLEITRFARIIPYMQIAGRKDVVYSLGEKVEALCREML